MNESSTYFDSYLPVYDVMPDEWEEAKGLVVEQLKRISNAVNAREIGWFLDEELLSGKQYIPSPTPGREQVFRSILRKVIEFPILNIGLNMQPHGILVDVNFTLIDMFAAGTNAIALTGEPIPNGTDTLSYDEDNVYITVAAGYTRGVCTMEYIQEL